MDSFDSQGVEIAYFDKGEGAPTLLIHGFASNAHVNWVYTGWVDMLVKSGRRVIGVDNRGHGESEKLYDPAYYGAPTMAEDAKRLLDHLDIESADVMGYSMGARITAFLAATAPDRVRTAVFGGLGYGMVTGVGAPEPIAEALEAESISHVTDATGRAFRKFAEQTKSDFLALAACMRSSRQKIDPATLATLTMPILVAVGTTDTIAGSADELAALLPDAEVLDIPGRDHMLAVGDKTYKAGTMEFWTRRS
ncbi:MAG: alpha/beta hydrolase [Hyphomicrobiales bacterium]|nr:MAG: alpha/beta hydrolase [Hyphomicrobiales bacterium]